MISFPFKRRTVIKPHVKNFSLEPLYAVKPLDVFEQTSALMSFRPDYLLSFPLLALWFTIFKGLLEAVLEVLEQGGKTSNRVIRKAAVSTSRHELMRS